MFHWMFLEVKISTLRLGIHTLFVQGLHLHNILVVNVFLTNTDTNHRIYLLVGWLAPLLSTSIWAIMAFHYMDHMYISTLNFFLAFSTITLQVLVRVQPQTFLLDIRGSTPGYNYCEYDYKLILSWLAYTSDINNTGHISNFLSQVISQFIAFTMIEDHAVTKSHFADLYFQNF